MSDWQKVRVTFTDADGNEASAVMWQLNEYQTCAYLERNHDDVGAYLAWAKNDKRVKVEPIRELPTGVGAVIRVTSYGRNDLRQDAPGPYGDLWMLHEDGWRYRGPHRGDPFKPLEIAADDWRFEILSEGIQL